MKKFNITIDQVINIVVSIISVLLSLLFICSIIKINILPFKLLFIIIVLLIVINVIGILFVNLEQKLFKIIGYIFLILLIIFNIVTNYYVKTTDKFLTKKFTKTEEVKNEPFNIYIGGVDFTEEIYDFNMIVSVNNDKVLLTSIPRDYHVNIAGTNIDDNLSYIGMDNINEKISSLEQLFNTKINYYVKINTVSLVNLIDTLGGIEFCSDTSFTTTHALILGSYDDTKGKKLYVEKGCKQYNGIEILTISRERLNIIGSDIKRQENCRKILISIINKLLNFESLFKYEELLNNLSNLYETNIPINLIKNIIKQKIDKKMNYNIEEIGLFGTETKGMVRKNTVYDYIMIPNTDNVIKVTNKINEYINLTK